MGVDQKSGEPIKVPESMLKNMPPVDYQIEVC